jgi:murein DD-endopeptidase MepM/ murein hydrolase activator NlpD
MQPSTSKKLAPAARAALGLSVLFAPMVGLAMEAPPTARHAVSVSPIRQLLDRLEADKPAQPVRRELVWRGADIDGDGAADFANPTGAAPRGHDDFGDGEFGASRDGGSRQHEGVDYAATADQPVQAPISGYVTKIGYAYAGSDLKFVEITNPALGYAARAFYVSPEVEIGQTVRLGEAIGKVASLQRRYPGITDHVHLEILKRGDRVNAQRLIVQRLVARA